MIRCNHIQNEDCFCQGRRILRIDLKLLCDGEGKDHDNGGDHHSCDHSPKEHFWPVHGDTLAGIVGL